MTSAGGRRRGRNFRARPLRRFEEDSFKRNGGHTFLNPDNEVCLAWLEGGLRQLRAEGQTKVVSYLESVLEEVLLEMEGGPPSVTHHTKDV